MRNFLSVAKMASLVYERENCRAVTYLKQLGVSGNHDGNRNRTSLKKRFNEQPERWLLHFFAVPSAKQQREMTRFGVVWRT